MNFSYAFRQQTKPSVFAALHQNKPNVRLQHPDNPAWTWSGRGSKPRWLIGWEQQNNSWDGLHLVPSHRNSGGNANTESVAS